MSEDLGTVSNVTLGSERRSTYVRQRWMKSRKSWSSVSRAIDRRHLVMRLLYLVPALASNNNITQQQQLKYTATKRPRILCHATGRRP